MRRLPVWLFATFVSYLSTAVSIPVTYCQTPELITSVPLENGTLELYASMPKPFGLDGRDRLFRFGEPPQLKTLVQTLKFGPWQETRIRGTDSDEYVLGFLYRNKNGELPAAQLRTVAAYRATLADGSQASYWPRVGDSGFNEISNYEWSYQLAPLVIVLPAGNTTLPKLEGAIVSLPQDVTTVTLNKDDIKTKATAYQRHVVVMANGVRKDKEGLVYEFVICTAPKKLKKGNEPVKAGGRGTDRMNKSMNDAISFAGIASTGERVSPNGQMSGMIGDAARRAVVSKLKSEKGTKAADNVLEEAIMGVLTDPNANYTTVNILFRREQVEFDTIEVTVRESTGDPIFQTFVLQDVPLGRTPAPETINEFVAKLPVEELALESPMKPRKWQDASGKFTITAKLLGVKDGKVALQKEDGSVANVPLDKLCEADRKYLEAAAAKK